MSRSVASDADIKNLQIKRIYGEGEMFRNEGVRIWQNFKEAL